MSIDDSFNYFDNCPYCFCVELDSCYIEAVK